jgi:hypothetical protein
VIRNGPQILDTLSSSWNVQGEARGAASKRGTTPRYHHQGAFGCATVRGKPGYQMRHESHTNIMQRLTLRRHTMKVKTQVKAGGGGAGFCGPSGGGK